MVAGSTLTRDLAPSLKLGTVDPLLLDLKQPGVVNLLCQAHQRARRQPRSLACIGSVVSLSLSLSLKKACTLPWPILWYTVSYK